MSREITPSPAENGGAVSAKRDHAGSQRGRPLKDTAEALGALWAALAGFTIGGFETLADRKAERRSRRIRSRIASVQPHLASHGGNRLRG